MEESQVPWSDLPPELWPLIGERLHTYIDVVRFRSVCRLWRDSLPKLNVIFPPPLSYPINYDGLVISHLPGNEILLFQRIIYRFSPVDRHNSVSSKSWLGKIESANVGDMRFERPIYFSKSFNKEVLKEVNFLDFRIQEVAKSYVLGFTHTYTSVIPVVNKVVVFNCITVSIFHLPGKLVFRKHGDTCWHLLRCDENSYYDDVIVYKGKIYTVDTQGRVFFIDSSSMELVQFSPPMSGVSGDLKHLVECGGELYVVDRFEERKAGLSLSRPFDLLSKIRLCRSTAKAIDFKVHRLDQNTRRCVEVKNLGNQALVLGVDCFSISAADVEGFEGNCIYFSHFDLGRGYITHVFHLDQTSIMESSLKIFRAPLVLLQSANDHSSSKRLKLDHI